jgi:hypothetical protein
MDFGEDINVEAVSLLQASVGEMLVLDLACAAVADGCDPMRELETSVVAPHSAGMWGALARIGLPVTFTAIERVVGTFARDRVVDLDRLVTLLETTEEIPTRPRLEKFETEIRGPTGMPDRQASFEALEEELISELRLAGLKPDTLLPRQIVALKQLRNECVHVAPKSTSPIQYFESAGFSPTARTLGLADLQQAIGTLAGTLELFSVLWTPDTWSSARLDLMSDLPIYVNNISERLHRIKNVPKNRASCPARG